MLYLLKPILWIWANRKYYTIERFERTNPAFPIYLRRRSRQGTWTVVAGRALRQAGFPRFAHRIPSLVKQPYQFQAELLVRTPAWPLLAQFDAHHLALALENDGFMEAIYLASPVLHSECRRWQCGQLQDEQRVSRLLNSLSRYYIRSASRSTPFGLFAGCSLLHWGARTHVRLSPRENARHTRLDMHYLCALAQQLAGRTSVKRYLRYRPNTSLYRAGDEFRYVEYYYADGVRIHQLSAVEASEPLRRALQMGPEGQMLPDLVSSLTDQESERVAATDFIEELVAAQVLVSELEPTVTGPEFFHHVQAIINRLAREVPEPDLQALAIVVEQVRHELSELDGRIPNAITDYQRLATTMEALGVPMEAGRVLQTDVMHGLAPGEPATLDAALQKTLREGLDVLTYLAPPSPEGRLADFTRRFHARYEEQEVELLAALDNESGLSYANSSTSRYSALVYDLAVEGPSAGSERARPQSPVHQFLRQKLHEASSQQHYSVDVTKRELLAYGLQPSERPLPPSLGVLFQLVGPQQVLLEGLSGSSAVNLLGRFAHASPGIESLVQQVTAHEQAQNPGVAFAEICHLPASRIGNLLQRPHFRALEIPYLAQSTLPSAQQVRVQDLCLSWQGGQLALRCRRTNQRIIPRLSTAHNFAQADALPIYQLLCDLQAQGLQTQLGVSWQAVVPDAVFWPRLTSGEAILAAATWNLTRAILHELLTATPVELSGQLTRFRAQWQLPRYFTLADGDNELLVDADSEWHVNVWLDAIRNRPTIQLKEFLLDPAVSPVRDAANRPYAHQFLALLLRQGPCYAAVEPKPVLATIAPVVTREFSLGSEWLYYKLYCGHLTADRVLLAVVRPLAAELRTHGLIDTWFFVRYADPDPHLRVRWHLSDPNRLGEVLHYVRKALQPYSSNDALWRIQTDTYRRELERYGCRTIGWSEALFNYQSQALLDAMAAAAPGETPFEPWLWGLGAVEELLIAFNYPLPRKLALMESLRDSLAQEFGLNNALKRQLETKYRQARTAVQQALASVDKEALPPALAAISRSIQNQMLQGQVEVPLNRLLGSYVHMLLNRVIPSDARLHELVLYDFLVRHYQSCLARQKS